MKKILFSLFIISLFITLASALESDYIYKAGQTINFKNPCINNGTFCSGSAVCNLTVLNPDGTVFIDDIAMANQGNYFNYTFPKTHTLGYYYYTQTCNDGGLMGVDDGYIQITPTGDTNILGFFIIIFLLAFGVLIWGIVEKNATRGILGTFALAILGLYVLFYGIDIYKNYLTNAFAIITLGIAGFYGTTIALDYLENG